MKRIIMSASAIVFVAALAYGATGAFFSDTETSSGNTFTAGSINLTVDSQSHYNNAVCTNGVWVVATPTTNQYPVAGTPCSGTWTATDLGASNQFFNFGDVKPGDQGEDTVSLHIDSNPAWACLDIGTNANNENGANEPELSAGDNTNNGPTDGELAGNISVIGWHDNGAGGNSGNNIWDADEVALFPQITLDGFNSTTSLTLADSTTGTPLDPTITNNLGIAWCAGSFTSSGPGVTPVCDGSSMGNITQTDSATSTVAFRVEQSRNNANFTCNAGPTPTEIDVTANDLTTNPTDGKWYFYDDTKDLVNNALGTFVSGPASPPVGTGSAQVTLATDGLTDAGSRVFLANSSFGGTLLSAITQMGFSEYSHSGVGGANEAPFFRFNVDFAGTNVFQKSLVYLPSDNGSVVKDSWQSWDLIAGGAAKWQYSGAFWPAGNTTVANTVAGTTARTWTSILADYPAIRMWAAGAQLGMRVGEPGPIGYTGNLDKFQINTGTGLKTYDFGN